MIVAATALLFVGAKGANPNYATGYTNAPITYARSLECESCIRGGFNYCLDLGSKDNQTYSSFTCDKSDRSPSNMFINETDPGGVGGGWLCSRGLADQMYAIIGGCRP
jgi:hypothetical protein